MLSNDIHDYYYVSQGKTTIPNMDDGEEFTLTDVRNRNSVLFTQIVLERSLSNILFSSYLIVSRNNGQLIANVDHVE